MKVSLECPAKQFYVKIPVNLTCPEYDEEACLFDECFCSCYDDFLEAVRKSVNMTSEILNTLKARYLSYHSCCNSHRDNVVGI